MRGGESRIASARKKRKYWVDFKMEVPALTPEDTGEWNVIGCDWFSTKNTSIRVGDEILLINAPNNRFERTKVMGIFPGEIDDEILVAYDTMDGAFERPLTMDLLSDLKSGPLVERMVDVLLRREISGETWKEAVKALEMKDDII